MSRRVAIFLPSVAGGGAERVLLAVSDGLAAQGYDVDLVLGNRGGGLASELPSRVHTVDLGCRHVRNCLPRLVAYLRRRRPACLLSTLDHANVLAVAATTLARTRTTPILRLANTLSETRPTRLLDRERVTYALAVRCYRGAHPLIAVSQGVANDLVEVAGVDPARVHVIPNPVVGPELFTLREERVDHEWFTPGSPPVVLGVGRLTRQKNFPLLLRAFAEVRLRRDARLVVLGEGEDRAALEQLAGELGVGADVAFLGFDPNPFRYMARAAVFASSSDWEGLPGALIQALACGVPVVATDCRSGPREILDGGRHGSLVPVGDAAALAAALLDALGAPPAPAPEQAWARYSVDEAVARYARVMEAAAIAGVDVTASPGSGRSRSGEPPRP
jgi:glycosyltransferase involved in cell wall biosynthesis